MEPTATGFPCGHVRLELNVWRGAEWEAPVDLETLSDKLIQDIKSLAAEELDTVRSYEEIVDVAYEDVSHRLAASNQDRHVRAVEPGQPEGVEGEKRKPIQFRK